MTGRIPATATVLTYQSAATIRECLTALAPFAEILVLDGGSTDGTVEIARAMGARVESQADAPGRITDFTAVRERSFRLASHDWIFTVDSDEIADATLLAAVGEAVARDDRDAAYRVNRLPVVDGRVIHHAYFSPDMVLRLVRRDRASWARGKRVHERLVPVSGVRVHDLPGELRTPWPSEEVLRGKDRQYLLLAFGTTLARRPSILRTLRAVLKNLARAGWILAVAAWLRVRYPFQNDVLSFRRHIRFARYHAIVARERVRQFFLGPHYAPPSF